MLWPRIFLLLKLCATQRSTDTRETNWSRQSWRAQGWRRDPSPPSAVRARRWPRRRFEQRGIRGCERQTCRRAATIKSDGAEGPQEMRELRRSSLESKSVSLLWPKSCCACLCRRLIRYARGGARSVRRPRRTRGVSQEGCKGEREDKAEFARPCRPSSCCWDSCWVRDPGEGTKGHQSMKEL